MSAGSSSMNSSDTCSCAFVNGNTGPAPRHCWPHGSSPKDRSEPVGKAPPALPSPPVALSPALALPAPGSTALRLHPTGQTEPWPPTTRQSPTPGTSWGSGGPGGGAEGRPGPPAAALRLRSEAARLASGAGGSIRGLLLSSKLGRPGGDPGEEGNGPKETSAGDREAEVLKPSANEMLCRSKSRKQKGAHEITSHN